VQTCLPDLLFMDKLMGYDMKELIVIHQGRDLLARGALTTTTTSGGRARLPGQKLTCANSIDCGCTIFTEAGIKDDLKAREPDHAKKIDALEYNMHNGKE
jgi:hypothetical protein